MKRASQGKTRFALGKTRAGSLGKTQNLVLLGKTLAVPVG